LFGYSILTTTGLRRGIT